MAEFTVVITICNWAKFQGRTDVKNASWFKLHHQAFFSPGLMSLSLEEKAVWFYLLCEASRSETRGTFTVNSDISHRVADIGKELLHRTVSKLTKLQMVTSRTLRGRYANVTQTCTREEEKRREEREEKTETTRFEFDEIYQEYPKKVGKGKGIAACQIQIKTLEDFEKLRGAIKRYRDYCQKKGTEEQFVKQFDTFMGCWRDWVDPMTGTVEKLIPPSRYEEIIFRCEICDGAGVVFSDSESLTATPCQCMKARRE